MKNIVAFMDGNGQVLLKIESSIVPIVGSSVALQGVDTDGSYRLVEKLAYGFSEGTVIVGVIVSNQFK